MSKEVNDLRMLSHAYALEETADRLSATELDQHTAEADFHELQRIRNQIAERMTDPVINASAHMQLPIGEQATNAQYDLVDLYKQLLSQSHSLQQALQLIAIQTREQDELRRQVIKLRREVAALTEIVHRLEGH